MTKRALTDDQKADRIDRRRSLREAAATRVAELRAWRNQRVIDLEKRRAADTKKAAKARKKQSRGTDRVPARLRGLAVTVETHRVGELGTSIIGGRPITANHAERRARGARSRPRPRRPREMPGAVERRLQRAQKDWAATEAAQTTTSKESTSR